MFVRRIKTTKFNNFKKKTTTTKKGIDEGKNYFFSL